MDEAAVGSARGRKWHQDRPEVIEFVQKIVHYNSNHAKKVPVKAAVAKLRDEYGISVSISTLRHYCADVLGCTWNGAKDAH